jgi:hypothetical protein
MDGTEKIVQRLTKHLDISTHLRVVAKADPGTRRRRQHLRTWQAGRLARTHADLLASPRFGLAATFFLTEVYSTKDVSKRDESVKRAVPAMTTFLPVSALETVADVIELDALSEDLDAAPRGPGHENRCRQLWLRLPVLPTIDLARSTAQNWAKPRATHSS